MKSTSKDTRGAKAPTRMHSSSLTPADALAMLASAVNYCRTAGLEVRAGNTTAGLTLCLPAARLAQHDENGEFVIAGASASSVS